MQPDTCLRALVTESSTPLLPLNTPPPSTTTLITQLKTIPLKIRLMHTFQPCLRLVKYDIHEHIQFFHKSIFIYDLLVVWQFYWYAYGSCLFRVKLIAQLYLCRCITVTMFRVKNKTFILAVQHLPSSFRHLLSQSPHNVEESQTVCNYVFSFRCDKVLLLSPLYCSVEV